MWHAREGVGGCLPGGYPALQVSRYPSAVSILYQHPHIPFGWGGGGWHGCRQVWVG
ncbi:hypothetical protein L208DRAFT_1396095, partial [Tricholoma matsutake]